MSDATSAHTDGDLSHSRERRQPWSIGLVATLVLVALGLLYANTTLLAAATVPLVYLVYGTVSTLPAEPSVAVKRTLDPQVMAPGDHVSVTLAVTNTSDRLLTDLRLIDIVPEPLPVTSGSPRLGRSLRPGETATTTYVVVAKSGEFAFGPPAVRLRSLADSATLNMEVPAAGDTRLTAATAVAEPPRQPTALPRDGQQSADDSGTGREFYATRPYQPGDPIRRINWRQFAKTGSLTTVQYRQEQAAETVVLVDCSPLGLAAPRPGQPTATELTGYAAERLHAVLQDAGVVTVVAAARADTQVPPELIATDGLSWIDSTDKRGRTAADRLLRSLQGEASGRAEPLALLPPGIDLGAKTDIGDRHHDTDAATEPTPIQSILTRLSSNAQVIVCTPLLDDWPVDLVTALQTRAYSTVVITPDATTTTPTPTPGQRLAGVHRQLRLDAIDRRGGRTVDWSPDRPIDRAIRASLPQRLVR
jgi:conserved repeat domain